MPGPQTRYPLPPEPNRAVAHRTLDLDGINVFYREAGAEDAPVVLLPHGYPCSSYEFRNFMPALADRWRLLAPDFPGFGYSDTPGRSAFGYDFDAYAAFLERFVRRLRVERFAIYLHDYGSQIGLRLAIRHPAWISSLIIQNGDIYEDALGPRYRGLLEYFADRTPTRRRALVEAVSEEGFRDEFLNDVRDELQAQHPPRPLEAALAAHEHAAAA